MQQIWRSSASWPRCSDCQCVPRRCQELLAIICEWIQRPVLGPSLCIGARRIRSMVCYVKEFRGLAVRGWLPMPRPVDTTPRPLPRLAARRRADPGNLTQLRQCFALGQLTKSWQSRLAQCLTGRVPSRAVSILVDATRRTASTSFIKSFAVCLLRHQRCTGVLRDKRGDVGLFAFRPGEQSCPLAY